MNGTGNQFFSRTGLTQNQHRESVGATLSTCESTLRSDSDDPTIVSYIEERSISSPGQVLVADSLFGLLAIVNVRPRRIPADDFPAFVQ